MKQKLIELKGEVSKICNYGRCQPIIQLLIEQTENQWGLEKLKNIIKQLDLIHIYMTLYTTTAECTFFFGTLSS